MAKLVLKQLQGQLFIVNSFFFFFFTFFKIFLLCDRLSNKYHNVHVTNKHQLIFHSFSSLQGDIKTHTWLSKSPFSTSRCCCS